MTDIKQTFAALVATAQAQVAKYPQYAGHFEGYRLARVKRDVTTKMGLAFARGEFVIATERSGFALPNAGKFDTAWSRRNACDTSLKSSDLEWIS